MCPGKEDVEVMSFDSGLNKVCDSCRQGKVLCDVSNISLDDEVREGLPMVRKSSEFAHPVMK